MDILKDLRGGKPCRWTGVCGEMSAVGGCTCGEAADEIERLREALSDLVAVQNGPPLIQYEREWNEAMSKALAALKEGE